MTIHQPFTSAPTGQFFKELSEKPGLIWGNGFNTDIQVDLNKTSRATVSSNAHCYDVGIDRTYWFLKPLTKHIYTPPNLAQKEESAKHLASLVNMDKEGVVSSGAYNVDQIVVSLEKLKSRMSENESNPVLIHKYFDQAILGLKQENAKYQSKKYERGIGLDDARDSLSTNFYKALSRRWTPGIGKFGFNQRFQIVEPADGEFKVHLESKPWFFSKMVKFPQERYFWRDMKPKAVPSAAKVATAEKLEAMIRKEAQIVRLVAPNTNGMVANLLTIKKNITRNTNSEEKLRIERAFDNAILELKKIGQNMQEDFNKSWKGFAWNHSVVPIKSWIVAPTFNKGLGLVKGVGGSLKGLLSPFYTVSA